MKKIIKNCGGIILVFLLMENANAATIDIPINNHREINVESSSTKEVKRKSPIIHSSYSSLISTDETEASQNSDESSLSFSTASLTSDSSGFGPNLILNPSFETTNASGNPSNWGRGGYGNNVRELIYPVPGNTGVKAAQVNIKSYISGDAKWFFDETSVSPGKKYEFIDYSKSNVPSIITVRYKMSDGSFIYKDIATIPASTDFQKNTVNITIPSSVTSLTVFHLINRVGNLTVDTYSLKEILENTGSNLVPNGDFENFTSLGVPTGWKPGGWGVNSRQSNYPVSGVNNNKAAKISISSYSSGDAKWHFTPINLSPGIYKYSDMYSSSVPTVITVQYENLDGSFIYKDIATLPPSSGFSSSNATFSVGSNVKSVTIFHLIKSVGTLIIDNVAIIKSSDIGGIFNTGAVSLRFDDGWLSQLENAIPKMNQYGLKGTFYIVSKQMADFGFTDYMSINQVKQIYAMGNEIGGHTKTHPYLSTLSSTDQQNEISGGRSDLLSLNVGPILSFAYPFGDYSASTIEIVKSAGYQSALATIDGNVTPTSDRYQLERRQPEVNTSFAQVKAWIDDAASKKQWLILTFHQIGTNGEQYTITPTMFNQIIDYLVSKNIPVITVSEAMKSLQ